MALIVVLWQSDLLLLELPPPSSEWAFEDTNIRDLQDEGLTGENVRLCMVDTGISLSHSALAGSTVEFKDFVGGELSPVDYGSISHGTLMAGLLLSSGYQDGIARGVTLGMAAALSADGDENTGTESRVASAIRWCIFDFEADIISLSLGGEQDQEASREGATVSATRQAIDLGIYVVAAAGNDGGSSDDGYVSAPGNVALAITVGASDRFNEVWSKSSVGEQIDLDGNLRQYPNQKPELTAPGVSIVSTGMNDEWYSSSGTSDATVFVAGALALILEEHPELKRTNQSGTGCIELVKSSLASSLSPDMTHDSRKGYGVLDATAWLESIPSSIDC
jgi:serine protease AprX